METLTIIQARTGSTRLPGKVMYPLGGTTALSHVINRVTAIPAIDETVVATSMAPSDNVIERYARRYGARVVCGSESNVLQRFHKVLEEYDTDVLVRVTADCPLVSPRFLEACVGRVISEDVDYVFSGTDRTFPRGVTCEVFTADSFAIVVRESTEPRHREHVTPYYREHPEKFELMTVRSHDVFDNPQLHDRTDLRLTLDEPADYHLLETVYREVDYGTTLPLKDAIEYIDQHSLADLNAHVEQKTMDEA